MTKKEIKHLKNQKRLLTRYNFMIENDRLFVKNKVDKIPNMNVTCYKRYSGRMDYERNKKDSQKRESFSIVEIN